MKRRAGFTVIEVILFLTISSALTMMLMIGTGSALQRQQYRDSVQSFSSFLKSQYGKVISVENDRESSGKCPISGADIDPISRGQSNCVIVGRYISSVAKGGVNRGEVYQVYKVYGISTPSGWQYTLDDDYDVEYQLDWGSRSRLSTQSDGSTAVAILMYRDPEVGNLVIRTDTSLYNQSNIGSFFTGGAAQLAEREICVYNDGWLTGEFVSVLLGSKLASSDAITTISSTGACS